MRQIRDYASKEGIRPSTLARISGLHKNTLRGIFRPRWSPRAETLERIAKALNKRAKAEKVP